MALLAFSAFLHCDEVIKLQVFDVSFATGSMIINLPKSKTDQFRGGSAVVMARLATQICPVAMLEQYFERAALNQSSTDLVFRGNVHTKVGQRLRKVGALATHRCMN